MQDKQYKVVMFVYVFFLLLLCPVMTIAQNQTTLDGLVEKLRNSKTDTNTCKVYDQLVQLLIYSDIEQTNRYNDSLAVLATKIQSDDWIWKSKLNKGTIQRFSGQFTAADSLFRELVEEAKVSTNEERLIQAYYQLASVNISLTRGEETLKYYQLAAKLAEKSEDKETFLSKIYNGIGTIHSGMGNFNEATSYIKRSIALSRATNDTSHLMIACNSLGVLYSRMDSLEKSKRYFSESLSLAKSQNNLTVMGMQLRNLGLIAWMKDDLQTAKRNYLEALKIRNKAGDPLRVLGSHYDLGGLYTSSAEYEKAEYHYKEALRISDEIGSIDSKARTLDGLAFLYEKKGEYKNALTYSRQAIALADSIDAADIQKKMLDLEAEYESVKKDVELKDKAIQITKQKNKTKVLTYSLVMIGLLSTAFLAFMMQRIKTNKKLAKQNQEIQKQKIEQLEKEKKILNLAGMIEGQEAERIRIAKDLHDGLGGLLTTIKRHVSNIQDDIAQIEKLKPYQKANLMIDDACAEVRRISQNLMPDILRLEGLHGAVDALIDQLEETHKLDVSFISEIETLRIDEVRSLFLFRIVQELLNNVVKHANATQVEIAIQLIGEQLRLRVTDDGKGFDLNDKANDAGLGLKSIKSRVNYLNGTIEILSTKNQGTKTIITLPKNNQVA